MKTLRLVPVVLLALAGLLVAAGQASADPGHSGQQSHHAYVCSGGNVPAGSYGSVVITGICYMPAGNVNIWGNLTITPGALLDAVTPGDPTTGTPVVPATVSVGGNVIVQHGAVLVLGCSPNISCAAPDPGISFDNVRGNLLAFGAQAVVIHDVSFGGDVSIQGGGGGTAAESCNAQMPPMDTTPVVNLEPWSEDANLDFIPVYTDFEDNSVGGSYSVTGLTTCWLGSIRNMISGDATFTNNTMGDPDATEIGNNLVGGNLACFDNDPAPQFGDGAAPDVVSGRAIGQCSFHTVLQNPAAEAVANPSNDLTGVGINEHFAVSTRSLGTYHGTHTATNVGTLPTYPITTSSGDAIVAELNDFTLTGNGLTGTADYTGGAPGQSPGEAFLATAYPDGSQSFLAYDTCASCSFDGQTGMVTLRAYGTVSSSGITHGTFLITSSGATIPTSTSPVPGLSTLTGWGDFWGTGSTVHVIEHLGFG
ncbi:MAG: hypothetical protein ABSG81_06380 [Acidimicrobiales bacterium]